MSDASLPAEVAARQGADGRRAITLSGFAGLALTGGVVVALLARDESWASVPFLLSAAAVVGILQLADRHVSAYDHELRRQAGPQPRRKLKRDPLAAGRGYLGFHARRAGWQPGLVIAGVWATWAVPAALFASLLVNAVYTILS